MQLALQHFGERSIGISSASLGGVCIAD